MDSGTRSTTDRGTAVSLIRTHTCKPKADVILAFFGANEAWDDNPVDYGAKLGNWVDETLTKKYNGQSAPVIVLFSPIAYENHGNPNLPDGNEQNERLKRITEATAKVAKDKKLEYVDLFTTSQKLYQETQSSIGSSGDPSNSHSTLTLNGIHLTSEGNDHLARIIHKALFGKDAPVKHSNLEQTRKAAIDKNWHWFNRYRATDGNNVWGGRSGLRFVDKQSNKDVLWHELDMIDVMTANSGQGRACRGQGRNHHCGRLQRPAPRQSQVQRGRQVAKVQRPE